MGHDFLSCTASKHHQTVNGRSSMANIPGLETWNLLLLQQTFQLRIGTVAHAALNISPLQVLHSYLPSGQGDTCPERRY